MHKNLRSFIDTLRREDEIVEVTVEVDPYLELAEIHRRVIEAKGKALFFTNVKNSKFRVVTNLFGKPKRIELEFGKSPLEFVKRAVEAAEQLLPPKLGKLWEFRDLGKTAMRLGTKQVRSAPVLERRQSVVDLEAIPFIQLWPQDGGHFNTLPLVYTESPSTGKHNLGIYRMQRYDKTTTGMHWQIGKGGGFHYFEAEERGESLPVTVFLGGPPSLIISAIAPLPEGVPELLLASLLAGEKLSLAKNPVSGGHRLLAESEFAFVGHVPPQERRPEGPFGDHYGYYSLTHDFPVFYADTVFHRKDAIYPATVVGKPVQEDFYIGDYLQELLSPLFPLVMPAVEDLWSYGQTGFHSLAAAVVKERYSRESLSAGFRILGEGQLTLTKFLLLTDKLQDLRDFRSLFEYILERADWNRDLHVFSQTAFDTLDYASGKINHGSKAVLIGTGDKKRALAEEFQGELPHGIRTAQPFCAGCLVVAGLSYADDKELANQIAKSGAFDDWQIIVLHDDVSVANSTDKFLRATSTRYEPPSDL
jgi:UbiD family decarboxylase